MSGAAVPIIIAIIIVGVLVFIAISLSASKPHAFDKQEYQARWLAIENAYNPKNPSSASMTILNADKLLDQAMIEMGIPGKTMGDRLKKVNTRLSQLDAVWSMHKIRNQIAHEPDYHLSSAESSRALKIYKQALKDLGAI